MSPGPRRSRLTASALIAAALLLPSGCEKGPAWKKHMFAKVDMTRAPMDEVRLPRSLWEKIEGLLHSAHGPGAGGGGHGGGGGPVDAAPKAGLPTVFKPLKVILIEKNHGILQRGTSELVYGPGGGELDLKDFVNEKSGSFYFLVEFAPEELEGVDRKVFFLSNSLIRKKGDERVGTGCNTYFDVSTAFRKAASDKGFLVNTTEGRHISALAGSYFFAAVHEGKLNLASLVIRDTSQRSLQCKR